MNKLELLKNKINSENWYIIQGFDYPYIDLLNSEDIEYIFNDANHFNFFELNIKDEIKQMNISYKGYTIIKNNLNIQINIKSLIKDLKSQGCLIFTKDNIEINPKINTLLIIEFQ